MWYNTIFTEEEKKGTHELAEQIVDRDNEIRRQFALRTKHAILREAYVLLREMKEDSAADELLNVAKRIKNHPSFKKLT
jgi:hypothetical protein